MLRVRHHPARPELANNRPVSQGSPKVSQQPLRSPRCAAASSQRPRIARIKPARPVAHVYPEGGIVVSAKAVRRWKWERGSRPRTAAVRCRKEQWYLVRAIPLADGETPRAALAIAFLSNGRPAGSTTVVLESCGTHGKHGELLGWFETPDSATHLSLSLVQPRADAPPLAHVYLHAVAERAPVSHPQANTPRWSVHRPPFAIERVVLPKSLSMLRDVLDVPSVQIADMPRTADELAALVRGAACVLDPAWLRSLSVDWGGIERMAESSCLLLDLESVARLLQESRGINVRLRRYRSTHELACACVEYSDFHTRGFALGDILPFGAIGDDNRFVTSMLSGPAWRKFANQNGFATLLSFEPPDVDNRHEPFSAAMAYAHGELIATDVPWLAAGLRGRPVAPNLLRHLLNMHFGAHLDDSVQYWLPSADPACLVRDIAECANRHPPLRSVRWAAAPDDARVMHLGLALPSAAPRFDDARESSVGPPIIIRTGRMDDPLAEHALSAEPMLILMRYLARERREAGRWIARHLGNRALVWQFDTAIGSKFAHMFDSAADVIDTADALVLNLRFGDQSEPPATADRRIFHASIPPQSGLLGDGSMLFQGQLLAAVTRFLDSVNAAG